MFFEQLEKDIVTQLKFKLGNTIEVEVEPENEEKNKTPFAKPRVTTLFDNSSFEKPNSTGYISQHETATLAIYIRCRALRGPLGIYTLAENVRRAIVGFAPTNWDKIWLLKFSFVKREENLWHYAVMISTKSQIVEDQPLETGPALVSSTTNMDVQQNPILV